MLHFSIIDKYIIRIPNGGFGIPVLFIKSSGGKIVYIVYT
jgi:hypothetical protein